MTEQTELESREIEKLISRFTSSYQNLLYRVEHNSFESGLRDASMSLRSYTEVGRTASVSAEKLIGDAMNSENGISKTMEQMLQQGSTRLQELCTRQNESAEMILSALPSLEEVELPVVRPFYDFYPDENGADLASLLGLGGSAVLGEAKTAGEANSESAEETAGAETLSAASEQEVNG